MSRTVVLALCVAVLSACAPAAGVVPSPAPASTSAPALAPTAAPAAASRPATRTPIRLAMGYIPSVQFAPFYVATERGYFQEAGLDITFQYGFESDLLKLVGTNELPFMIGSGEEVILGRSQDLPVRYVMRWYRKFPVVLFAKQSSGIKAPRDVEGKQVGIVGLFGASYVGWQALVYGAGIDAGRVQLQSIGFTQAAAVSQNQVDAALDYIVNGPVQLKLAGEQVNVIPVSNYVDLPSNGIITNEKMLRDRPEVVRALVGATLRGLRDTLADPDAAFEASLRAVPEAGGPAAATSRAIFDESVRLWQADAGELGRSDPASWAKAAEFMQKMRLVDRLVPASDLFTNDFLPSP